LHNFTDIQTYAAWLLSASPEFSAK
jgi:hypothetical protein